MQKDGAGDSMAEDKNPRVARTQIEPVREKQMAGFLTPATEARCEAIEGFVRHLQRRHVGMHQRQCPRNLLGRVICFQVTGALVPQGGGPKAVCDARPYRPGRMSVPHRHGSRLPPENVEATMRGQGT